MDHTLLVLGMLRLKHMHGYQLSDLIDRRLKQIADLKKPTLYHILSKLEADGDVTKSASRQGHRPERYTYRLTSQGKEHFNQRLRQNLQDAHETYFGDDVGLLFLSELPVSEARALLEMKRAEVEKRLAHIKEAVAIHAAGTPAYYTLRHHEMHLDTEREYFNELLDQLKKRAVRQDILECLASTDERAKRYT